jgi:hypothetical protein
MTDIIFQKHEFPSDAVIEVSKGFEFGYETKYNNDGPDYDIRNYIDEYLIYIYLKNRIKITISFSNDRDNQFDVLLNDLGDDFIVISNFSIKNESDEDTLYTGGLILNKTDIISYRKFKKYENDYKVFDNDPDFGDYDDYDVSHGFEIITPYDTYTLLFENIENRNTEYRNFYQSVNL